MKALIVDDERLARNELKRLLENFPKINIVGEAANAEEAVVLIDQLHPDLLFLDIQMPGKTGFDLRPTLKATFQKLFSQLLTMNMPLRLLNSTPLIIF